MTFNPFKTAPILSSKPSARKQKLSSDEDSWHSQPQSISSSGPLAWFSIGWTSSSAAQSNALNDDDGTTSISPTSTLDAPISPTTPMTMIRASHSEGDMKAMENVPTASTELTSNNMMCTSSEAKNYVGSELPSYPKPKRYRQQHQNHISVKAELLVEDFRPKENRTLIMEFPNIAKTTNGGTTMNSSPVVERNKRRPFMKESEESYPGFALYQSARASYCLGKYNEALETTTQCLAVQKQAMANSRAQTITSPKIRSQVIMTTQQTRSNDRDVKVSMTALDLRSNFVSEVGRSMRGVVQSIKTSSAVTNGSNSNKQHEKLPSRPLLTKLEMTPVVSRYPLSLCIARTLLLRGKILAECGLYGLEGGGKTDYLLLIQAIRNIEMSVAILRKIDQEYELATSLTLLGTLMTLSERFDEADRAFEESLSIFRALRLASKYDQSHAVDEDVIAVCRQALKKINEGIINVLYHRGKLYQCRRMHNAAFRNYRKALTLSTCNGAKRHDGCVERIVRCMKSRSAIERIVSAYIDDQSVV